jgi:hypothetical protein
MGHPAKNILLMHGGVCGDDAVDPRNHDEAVRHQKGTGECRIRIADGTNCSTPVIDFHQTASLAHLPLRSCAVSVLEGGKHVPIWQPNKRVRVHVTGHIGK